MPKLLCSVVVVHVRAKLNKYVSQQMTSEQWSATTNNNNNDGDDDNITTLFKAIFLLKDWMNKMCLRNMVLQV